MGPVSSILGPLRYLFTWPPIDFLDIGAPYSPHSFLEGSPYFSSHRLQGRSLVTLMVTVPEGVAPGDSLMMVKGPDGKWAFLVRKTDRQSPHLQLGTLAPN